ncbi:258_t:CDS:2 [Ambispora leptoticha]|uniref:258_t:CDS:1 n=1 Tax=Ambispora leptoticha TaxID=144679 RepID=A0A9N8W062_9GLOM|nr:258_t:CDS:2 [Ambispora leptoticha]
MSTIPKFLLSNGVEIPALGLGTYRIKTRETVELVIKSAITLGYRLIDSAIGYRNEEFIGRTLLKLFEDPSLGLKREDVFITSKLPPRDQGYEACYNAVNASLRRFGIEYIDLFLIHWPGTQGLKLHDPQNAVNRHSSWQALERLYDEKKIRAIGVSNYTHRHLTQLLSTCRIIPAVLQVEFHPLLYQKDIWELCKKHGIRLEAYSSLGEGNLVNGNVEVDGLEQIALKHGVTKAQVLLRWGYQHEVIVIPKSTSPERIKTNAEIFHFELSKEEMELLDSASDDKKRRFCWDPTEVY